MTRRRQLILLAYVTLGAFFIAHALNAWVAQALLLPLPRPALPVPMAAPVPTSKGSARLAEEIVHSGAFVSAPVPGASAAASAVPQPANPLAAAKKIKAVGTVVGEGVSALAVIEDVQSKKQTLYHLYERVPGVGELVEVRQDGIWLREGAQQEFLAVTLARSGSVLPEALPPPTSPFSPGRPQAEGPGVTHSVVDALQSLAQARGRPTQ